MPPTRPAPPRRRGAAVAAGVVAAAYLLAGCGVGGGDVEPDRAAQGFAGQRAQDIVDRARADTTAAGSLRVRGDLVVGEQVVSIDLRVDQARQCAGTVEREGAVAEVLGVDGAYWYRPDAAYWAASLDAADAAVVVAAQRGRWVATDEMAALCDPSGLFGPDEEDPDVRLATLGTGEVAGQQVVRVRRTDAGGQSTVSAVATSAPHYLRQVVGEGEARATRIVLGEYGEPLDVAAPAADEQVPLDRLPLPG